MQRIILILASLLFAFISYAQQSVSSSIKINKPAEKVWDIITNPKYAKILGNEFDKTSFIESDWQLGSTVHFKYEPDRIVTTGTISKLIEEELIQIDYDFSGYIYIEKFDLLHYKEATVLQVYAGPYGSDFEAQIVVWNSWMKKVKELSEKE